MERAKRRRARHAATLGSCELRARRAEALERRLALAVSVSWTNPDLTIVDASGGALGIDVYVSADANGWVQVSDVETHTSYWDGFNFGCSADKVASIYVEGSASPGFGDTIDLTGVYKGPFTDASLPGNIVVKGLTGNDTIGLGGLGEIAYGGFGNDSIVGGSGNDTIYGGNNNGTEGGYDIIYGEGGNDYLKAESTAGAQVYDGNGDPIPSSEVYGGDGNDYITDADAFDKKCLHSDRRRR